MFCHNTNQASSFGYENMKRILEEKLIKIYGNILFQTKGVKLVKKHKMGINVHARTNWKLQCIWQEFRKNRYLFLLILPAVIYVFIFSYLPFPGIIIAFKNYNYNKGIWGSDWVGFGNFGYLFQTGAIYRISFNTVVYNLLFIFFDLVFQVGIAVILSEIIGKKIKKIAQSMLLMPYFISWVVAGAIVYNVLGTDYGLINSILESQGMGKCNFMNNPSIWPGLFVFFHVWKGLGYGSVVYLAAVTGIDQEIYEAAQIDGAGIMQRILRITIPLLKPTIVVLLLLHLGNIIKGDFAMFYNLTGNNALLYSVSDIIDTFVYRSMIQTQNFGMSAAAGLYQSVMGFVIIMIFNTIIRKFQPDYALF